MSAPDLLIKFYLLTYYHIQTDGERTLFIHFACLKSFSSREVEEIRDKQLQIETSTNLRLKCHLSKIS